MKNIVFGVYRFLGFHICNHLLENGEEVAGHEWMVKEDEAEEKKQFIGRNANYSDDSREWESNDEIKLYISLYDYLDDPSYSSEQVQQLLEYMDCFVENLQKNAVEIIVLLREDHLLCNMSDWKLKMEQNHKVRYLYISELYGTWMPANKVIMKIIKKDSPVLKADMSKYIYVYDFFQSWKNIMAIEKKEIHVEGKQGESWKRDLLAYVDEEAFHLSAAEHSAQRHVDLIIEAKTSLREGIELIKEHNEKLEMLRKWNS